MATENKTRNGHFVLIPLSMIRGLIKDPTLIYRIAMTGIYVSSQKLEVDFEEAIVTFIAIKYRDTLSLGIIMYEWYEKMKRNFPEQKELNKTSIVDKETHQINVNIDKEIEFLKIYGQKNPKFFDDLLAWYRVRMMIHLLEYEIDFLTMGSFEMGQQFMNERPELKTDPLIALGLGRRTYISYRFKTDEDFVKAIEKGSVLRQVAKAKESRRDLLNSLRNSERSE